MDILTLVMPSGEKCCLPWQRCTSWEVSELLGQTSVDIIINKVSKIVEPLIAMYIRDQVHKQQFSDGDFTLINSTGLTISPAIWPTDLLPGTEAFLRIGGHVAHDTNDSTEAHVQDRSIQQRIDRACSHIAMRIEKTLSQLEEMDRQIDTLRRTVDETVLRRHQDQDSQQRRGKAVLETQHEVRERDRDLERDRRDRERESERDRRDRERESGRDRRQREREHAHDVTARGEALFRSPRNIVRSRSAESAIGTDLKALREQVAEITTTLQRVCGEGTALGQMTPLCQHRKLRCLRFFACRPPLRCNV